MLIQIALLLITVSSAPAAAPAGSVEERTYISLINRAAREMNASLEKMQRRTFDYWLISRVVEGVDDNAALAYLVKAEKVAKPNTDDHMQVIEGIASIDPERARAMIPKIREDYWREFASTAFGGWVTYRHPEIAVREAPKRGDVGLSEDVHELCRTRVDIAVKYVKMLRGVDKENLIVGVAGNLEPTDAEEFLNGFGSNRPPLSPYIFHAAKPSATGEELLAAGAKMRSMRDRVDMTLSAIKAFKRTNPKRARDLADGLCKQAISSGDKPMYHESKYDYDVDWSDVLLPDIAFVDTPVVRDYLERTGKKKLSDPRIMEAWSNLDINRAKSFEQEPNSYIGPHGQSIAESYVHYLCNLAKVDPKGVARKLASIHLVSPSATNFIYADEVLRAIYRDHPEQAKDFCDEPTPWRKHFGANPRETVDNMRAYDAVVRDPLNHMADFKRLFRRGDKLPLNYDVGPNSAWLPVTLVAYKNVSKAIEMSAVEPDPANRVDILMTAYDNLKRVPFARRELLLSAALRVADGERTPRNRFSAFETIGLQAHRSWQRLQPWPLKNARAPVSHA